MTLMKRVEGWKMCKMWKQLRKVWRSIVLEFDFRKPWFYFFLGDNPEYGAEIEIHPNGKWLYTSNRGTGPIVLYHIKEDGTLINKKVLLGVLLKYDLGVILQYSSRDSRWRCGRNHSAIYHLYILLKFLKHEFGALLTLTYGQLPEISVEYFNITTRSFSNSYNWNRLSKVV